MGSVCDKPHAVCIPYPAQGHVTPMLKLAKLLHNKGFYITLVNTEYNHRRLLKSRGSNALDGLPDFRFETIPDGLPPVDDVDATQDIPALCYSISKTCKVPFAQLLCNLNSSVDVPNVSFVVSDGVMTFTQQATEELGIPNVLLWTASACGCLGYAQYSKLVADGIVPFKDERYEENGELERVIDWIPGMKDIFRLKDIPSFIRTTDPNDIMLNYFIGEIKGVFKASAVIMNTFDDFEQKVLNILSPMLPPIYTIGPLQLLLKNIPHQDNSINSLGSNLWKEEPQCLQWLNTHKPNSVVFVNFGSITVMSPQQMLEFACGLASSKQPFLWIIRPDLVKGESAILPAEFVEETKETCLLASWCPQEQVLNHPAVGGFLTHSGWNSTIESVCGGVPMICWPFFAEQQTNCRFACMEWGNGMEIDSNVKRDEVEKLVRELMEGEKGIKMRSKAMEWKKKAEEATGFGGSSYSNFEKLVNEVLLPYKFQDYSKTG